MLLRTQGLPLLTCSSHFPSRPCTPYNFRQTAAHSSRTPCHSPSPTQHGPSASWRRHPSSSYRAYLCRAESTILGASIDHAVSPPAPAPPTRWHHGRQSGALSYSTGTSCHNSPQSRACEATTHAPPPLSPPACARLRPVPWRNSWPTTPAHKEPPSRPGLVFPPPAHTHRWPDQNSYSAKATKSIGHLAPPS